MRCLRLHHRTKRIEGGRLGRLADWLSARQGGVPHLCDRGWSMFAAYRGPTRGRAGIRTDRRRVTLRQYASDRPIAPISITRKSASGRRGTAERQSSVPGYPLHINRGDHEIIAAQHQRAISVPPQLYSAPTRAYCHRPLSPPIPPTLLRPADRQRSRPHSTCSRCLRYRPGVEVRHALRS